MGYCSVPDALHNDGDERSPVPTEEAARLQELTVLAVNRDALVILGWSATRCLYADVGGGDVDAAGERFYQR